jgi:hypothetical protein
MLVRLLLGEGARKDEPELAWLHLAELAAELTLLADELRGRMCKVGCCIMGGRLFGCAVGMMLIMGVYM